MKLPDTRVIVFNIAAGMITVAALVAVVRSLIYTPALAPCTERYPSGTVFALERGGVLLTSTDLQARLSGKDVGLGDNVQIARIKGAPAPVAIGVTLGKGSISPHTKHEAAGGVSFPWEPRSMQGKTSACLAYSVLLPAGFDFHQGGSLPGIRGTETDGAGNDDFAALLAWRGNGRLGVTTEVDTRFGPIEVDAVTFPDGRWVKIDEEVVLNEPGQGN